VGVQSYAVDFNDTYPAQTFVTPANMQPYVDNWPDNPWDTANPMTRTTGRGNFSYTVTSSAFTLIGFGKSGTGVITVP
jgi:hypothetical protein